MKEWEDLHKKVQEAEAVNSNIRHLISVLEHDNFWIDRHKFTGPVRAQIDTFEMSFNEMKNLIIEFEEGHEAFHDAYDQMKHRYFSNIASEEEEEYIYHIMSEGIKLSLDGSVKMRDDLIRAINGFREAQNLLPLDGGLSPLN